MSEQQRRVLRQIDLAFNVGTVVGMTDAELVERFVAWRGPRAEAAFAALVRRHGPMVHRVCRAIVRDHHDAQDASQATFLILARKAGSLRVASSLGPWLYGVACHVARNAKAAANRRRTHESRVAGMTRTHVFDHDRDDVGTIVHEEIARMPDRYRDPIVLCDLQGRTYGEAARLLGRPIGTIKSRLARGREYLRGRMMRRGLAPDSVMLTSAGPPEAGIASIDVTARIAARIAAGCIANDAIPAAVLTLTEGAMKTMFFSKLKLAAAILVIGCGTFCYSAICGQSSPSEAGAARLEDALSEPRIPDSALNLMDSRGEATDAVFRAGKPWETVVRIKVVGPDSTGFGSGNVISSSPDESIILTCAHIFKFDGPVTRVPAKQFSRPIVVDVFDGNQHAQAALPPNLNYVASFPAEAIDFDFTRDVGLIRFRPGRRIPASQIVPPHWQPELSMKLLTIGCSEGHDPTVWETRVTNPRVRRLSGNPDYEAIECEVAPKQGRTGGGLFTSDGILAGVCDFAEPQQNRGWYASPASIYRLLDRNHLAFLYTERAKRLGPSRESTQGGGVSDLRIDLDSDTRPQSEAELGRILDEWARRSSAHTSAVARFTFRERDATWHEDVYGFGRIVLTSAGRMFFDLDCDEGGKHKHEHIIRTDDAMHQFDSNSKQHLVQPMTAKDRGRLPMFFALPFGWNLSAAGLKSRFDITLLASVRPESYLIRFRPLTPTGREIFSRAYVALDRSTYLPNFYVVVGRDGMTREEYCMTEVRCDEPIPEARWRIPEDKGWRVTHMNEWVSRLFQFDLDLAP